MKKRKLELNKYVILASVVMVALLTISVGFSALSTSLSINGNVSFAPVGMIRVMSISQDNFSNATGLSESITPDSIKTTVDFNNADGTATYNVVIRNLGQVDYKFIEIEKTLFSNEQIEYVLTGFAPGDIIGAKEEKTFKITFKYKEGITGSLVARLNSELKFVFQEYEDNIPFKEVFAHEGACTFNGPDHNITGESCPEFLDKGYIDTGIALYNEENWEKDYEIGFTIDSYDWTIQTKQAVFVNTKYENEAIKYPGLVFRAETNSKNLELTQTLNGTKAAQKITTYNIPLMVRIFRIDGVIYYSLNGGQLLQLQDINNLYQPFDTTTWFGATPDVNGVPIRNLAGTISHMYIKLGDYSSKKHIVTFDANGGAVAETTREVSDRSQIGELPIPVNAGFDFDGWYTDKTYTTKINANTIVFGDVTYYAKWSNDGVVEMNGNYYLSVLDAINNLPVDGTPTTLRLVADVSDNITIPAGKNVIIDFGNHTFSNRSNDAIIENNGSLTIVSGNFVSNGTTAVINNNNGATLNITGGTISATGTKQAVYNDGGTVSISGNAYLSATSSIRAAVHNLNNGTMTITSGTIVATNNDGLKNESGTLVIGNKDGSINTTDLIIQGNSNGITSSVAYSLYDGTIRGIKNATNNNSLINDIEIGYVIKTGEEAINGLTYKTLYLGIND